MNAKNLWNYCMNIQNRELPTAVLSTVTSSLRSFMLRQYISVRSQYHVGDETQA